LSHHLFVCLSVRTRAVRACLEVKVVRGELERLSRQERIMRANAENP